MSVHGDMLKKLLATKKGTATNRKAVQEQGKAMQALAKVIKIGQAQVSAPAMVKSTARGA